ncbi:MAG: hypothetical protein R3F37_00155 [Candidatus Competibacteraceae bacterium]
MLRSLNRIIEPQLDDVRCYPLPPTADVVLLGQQLFPEDILLIRDGRNVLRLGAAPSNAG